MAAIKSRKINPAALAWARERLFPTVEEAAGPLKTPAHRLAMWERGEDSPTYKQAGRIAGRLRIPQGYLYLRRLPPEFELPLPDYRDNAGAPPSLDLLEVVHNARLKQEWHREEVRYQERPPLPYAGRFNIDSSFREIAADIGFHLYIDDGAAMRRESASWGEFLGGLVRRAESAGVIVLRSGVAAGNVYRKLELAEFRGFALADDYSPFIFINARDSLAGQTFTLAHELAHIWVNESALCRPDICGVFQDNGLAAERLGDAVAGEILRPEVAYLRQAPSHINSGGAYWKQYGATAGKGAAWATNGAAKGYQHLIPILTRNSRWFTEAIIAAFLEDRIDRIETAKLLNVRGATLDSLSSYLLGKTVTDA